MDESIDFAKKFDLPKNIRVITSKNKVTRVELKLRGRLVGFSRDCDMMFLETLFWYDSGFYGATGYNMRTLEQSEIDNGRNVDGNGFFAEMWKCAVTNNNTTDSLSEFAKQMLSEAKDSGLFYPGDDDSFRYETEDAWDSLTDEIRELAARAMAAGKMVEPDSDEAKGETNGYSNFVSFSVTCCGRFGGKWRNDRGTDVLVAPKETLEIIDRFENGGEMSLDEAISLMKRVNETKSELDVAELKEKYGRKD